MHKAKITSKGQLTIPKPVRDRLNLEPGDRVLFELGEDSVTMRALHHQNVESLFARLAGTDLPYPGGEAEREAARKAASDRLIVEEP